LVVWHNEKKEVDDDNVIVNKQQTRNISHIGTDAARGSGEIVHHFQIALATLSAAVALALRLRFRGRDFQLSN